MTRLGRQIAWALILCSGAVAVAANALWILHFAATVSLPPDQHFPIVAAAWKLDREFGSAGAVTTPFYWIATLTGAQMGALALALGLRRRSNSVFAFDLASAFACLALTAAWFFLVRVFDEFGIAPLLGRWWAGAIDVAMVTLGSFGLAQFILFLLHFPTRVMLDDLWQPYARSRNAAAWVSGMSRWLDERVFTWERRLIRCSRRRGWRKTARWFFYDHLMTRGRLGLELSAAQRSRLSQWLNQSWWVGAAMPVVLTGFGFAVAISWRTQRTDGVWEWISPAFAGMALMLSLVAWHSMLHKYAHLLPEQRRQIDWILWGTISGILLLAIAAFGIPIAVPIADGLHWLDAADAQRVLRWHGAAMIFAGVTMPALVVLGIALSVFYHGAIDPGLAIRRTAVYSLLGLILTTVFVAIEGTVSSAIVLRMNLPAGTAPAVAGTVVALAFGPVRKRVDTRVERLLERLRSPAELANQNAEDMAIAFSDLSGYTALSETDQRAALTLAALFHKLARECVAAHGGRVVKTIGDAVLLAFPHTRSAVDAVVALHHDFPLAARALALPALALHSGIHFGAAITARDGDLYGNAVNLAARLQGTAQAGEIILSDAAATRLSDVPLLALGALALRNVAQPVACWRLLPGADALQPQSPPRRLS